jgi:hypothetical protein
MTVSMMLEVAFWAQNQGSYERAEEEIRIFLLLDIFLHRKKLYPLGRRRKCQKEKNK